MAGLNLQPYQEQLVRLLEGGFKAGQMSVISAGRQTGKSHYYSYMKGLKNRIYGTNLCKEIMLPMAPESKYKFSRAKWYTAKLNGDAIWRLSDRYNQIIAWCTEQYGPHPTKHDAWSRWYVGLGYINFRDERDFVLYQLRWA